MNGILYGIPVQIERLRPKIQIDPEIHTEGFAHEFNSWLISFFGYHDPLCKDGEVIEMNMKEITGHRKVFHMNERTWQQVQQAIRNGK